MEPIIGQLMQFTGNFPPRGWAICDGRLLSIETHSVLYSIIGNKFGGDGIATFALPDLRHQKTAPMIESQHVEPSTEAKNPNNKMITLIALVGTYPSKT